MNQVLYRKWRPQAWDDVVGQQHIIQTLRQAVVSGRVAHAYLFSGPRGTGKTSTARILAKAVNCLEEDPAARPCNKCHRCVAVNEGAYLDLIEIDAASNTSVEDVRDLRDRVSFAPNDGRFKIYIIDEVHMLSTAAFNALLKTLEEPPAHAIFILATTEAHKIPATVVSRCQRHEFRRLSVEEMVAQLSAMAEAEGLHADRESLEAVARQATGSMRDAISLLDQLGSLGEAITLARTLEILGSAGSQAVQQFVDSIAKGDTAEGLQIIHRATDSGADARQFARQAVDYLRGVMMASTGNVDLVEAAPDTRTRMKEIAAQIPPAALVRAIRAFSYAAGDLRSGWRPQLPLELALVDSILEPSVAAPELAGKLPSARTTGSGIISRPAPARPAPPAAPQKKISAAAADPEPSQPQTSPVHGLTLTRNPGILGARARRRPRARFPQPYIVCGHAAGCARRGFAVGGGAVGFGPAKMFPPRNASGAARGSGGNSRRADACPVPGRSSPRGGRRRGEISRRRHGGYRVARIRRACDRFAVRRFHKPWENNANHPSPAGGIRE